MKTPTKSQLITYFILFILLVGRIWENTAFFILRTFSLSGAKVIPAWFWGFTVATTWIIGFNMISDIPLIIIAIVLNRDDLPSLNIDIFSIFLIVLAGLIASKEYFYGVGIPAGLAAVLFSIYVLWKRNLDIRVVNSDVWRLSLVGVAIFILCFLGVSGSIDLLKTEKNISSSLVPIFLSVVEEVMYRGMLWMFLRNLKWGEGAIVLGTAFLFWMSHLNLFESPFNFWLYVPLLSLVLGYVVFRTKSITTSTVFHMLSNLFAALVFLSH